MAEAPGAGFDLGKTTEGLGPFPGGGQDAEGQHLGIGQAFVLNGLIDALQGRPLRIRPESFGVGEGRPVQRRVTLERMALFGCHFGNRPGQAQKGVRSGRFGRLCPGLGGGRQHPEPGSISPGLCVPIAEQAGLMNLLGCWTLARVLQQRSAWPDLDVSINLSPLQLTSRGFLTRKATAEAAVAAVSRRPSGPPSAQRSASRSATMLAVPIAMLRRPFWLVTESLAIDATWPEASTSARKLARRCVQPRS